MTRTTNDRRSVAVRIAGQEYKIRSAGDEEALIRIAGYVDRAMDRVRERTGTVGSLDVAVLTCLNLAREILALHEQRSGGIDEGRLRGLIEQVESSMRGRTELAARSDDEMRLSAPPTDADTFAQTPQTEQTPPPATVRTLELPSVEDLRDHRVVPPAAAERAEESASVPRMAAGGRERNG